VPGLFFEAEQQKINPAPFPKPGTFSRFTTGQHNYSLPDSLLDLDRFQRHSLRLEQRDWTYMQL
jgi:hypothetical protein